MDTRGAAGERGDAVEQDQLISTPEHGLFQSASPLGNVIRGAMILFSAQPVTWAATLLTTMFVPRYLGASDVGEIAMLLTSTGFVGTILGLGLSPSLTRRVAADPTRASVDASAGLVLVLGLSIPVALGLAVAVPLLSLPSVSDELLRVFLVGMVVATAQAVLSAVLIGQQRHARFAWLNSASVAVTAVAGVAYLVAGGGVLGFAVIAAVVGFVTLVLGWHTAGLGFDRGGFRVGHLIALAREGLPFLGSNVANRVRVDGEIMLLAGLTTQQAIGWWVSAHRIIGFPVFVPTLITTPLFPVLSQCVNDRVEFSRTIRRVLILILVLTVPICALILALAPAIPRLLGWRADFEGSVPLMVLLSVQLPLVAVGMVLGIGLLALGDERRWLIVNGATTGISVGLGLLTIPFFDAWFQNGALGMAAVRVLCELVMITGALMLLPRGTVGWATAGVCGRTAVAGIVLAVVASWLMDVWLPLAVAAAGLAYVLMVLVLRIVNQDDLSAVGRAALARLAQRLAPR